MKTNRFWIILISTVVIVSLAAALIIGNVQGTVAHIYVDGQLLETIDLSAVTGRQEISISSNRANTITNKIEIEQGRIRVIWADCPDGYCVRQGWISGGLTPIVCLPNGLVIQIDGASDIDGIVR